MLVANRELRERKLHFGTLMNFVSVQCIVYDNRGYF